MTLTIDEQNLIKTILEKLLFNPTKLFKFDINELRTLLFSTLKVQHFPIDNLTINLSDNDLNNLQEWLKYFIYQPSDLSLAEVKELENLVFVKLETQEFCLIRKDYV